MFTRILIVGVLLLSGCTVSESLRKSVMDLTETQYKLQLAVTELDCTMLVAFGIDPDQKRTPLDENAPGYEEELKRRQERSRAFNIAFAAEIRKFYGVELPTRQMIDTYMGMKINECKVERFYKWALEQELERIRKER